MVAHGPGGGDASVNEDGAVARDGQTEVGGVDDAAAVVVAEDGVVEGRKEPDGGRGVGVGAGRVGQVEQFASAFVTEDDEFLPGRSDGGGKAGEAAPGTQIRAAAGPYAAR